MEEFYWKIVIVPKLLQMFGIVLAILAVTLVWSEVTFFRKDPVLSIYALFIADWFAQAHQYFLIQLTCVLLLVFMCVTVYWTVFRVRFFNYYYLSPHHHTDEYTLLFSGMLLCRLTPSICLNFLGVTHMDNSISNDATQQPCSFTEVMGHLSIVYFISDGFNIYFPLVLIVLCLATLFNLGSHVLSFIGFQQFMGDGELTSELIDEGQQLIKREHRRIERENRGEQRRKEWDERLNRAGRDAEKYASGAGGAGGDNDDIEANFNAGKQQSYAGRRGGGRNMHAEAMRAKYSRNGPSGAPSFIMSKTNQSNGNSNGTANKLDSASDNSATDLLDEA
ncbi:G-protein coupled receptor-associated protein LMBRD2-like [Symsagittifera roscoffensis]|uniref:G-protein coupled receptor-associated protein LMBRD2-like n=1 Tax=Symsagittifera roscoffensis TaxID=84072 RepID=UPI00307CBD8F